MRFYSVTSRGILYGMADDHWSPTYLIPEQPAPEPVWSLRKNQETVTCELRDLRQYGFEAQLFRNGHSLSGRRFETRDLALQYVSALRGEFERRGWAVSADHVR